MNHFPIFDNIDNMGGNKSFMFIPEDEIVEIKSPVNFVIQEAPVLLTGKTFLNGYASHKTLRLSEIPEQTAAGTHFNSKISGFYPKIIPNVVSSFVKMKERMFVVAVLDNNKQLRLVGTKEQPLQFTFSLDTGANAATRNGITFEFTGQSILPSPFLASQVFIQAPIFNPVD